MICLGKVLQGYLGLDLAFMILPHGGHSLSYCDGSLSIHAALPFELDRPLSSLALVCWSLSLGFDGENFQQIPVG